MFTDYALFDIRIRGAGPERYDVEVQSALGGDASGVFLSPSGDSIFQQQIARLQALDTDEELLIEIGQRLFQALFVGGIKEVYTRSQGKLKSNQGLRLRFTIDPAQTELAGLPWEFLYDPDQGPMVLLDAPIVRYLAQQAPPPVLESPLPLKVLLTGAVTPPQADVEREISEVRTALQELEQSGHVTIHVEEHLTRTKLQRLLREGFQIWHFAGHGGLSRDKRSSALVLEDSSGDADSLSAIELGILLNRSGLQLILLDACDSGQLTTAPYRSIAPALIRAQVGAVVAMQFKVPTEATRPFAIEFYRALAEGFPIDACVTEGRKAVMAATGLYNPDWGIPVVYTRAPDGRLFAPPTAPAKPSAAAEQGGGINFTLGSGNTLSNSNVTFQNVGNNTASGNASDSSALNAQANERAERMTELNELIDAKRRVLHKLQMQAATYGISTPPHVSIEIENTEREIAKLKRELQTLDASTTSPQSPATTVPQPPSKPSNIPTASSQPAATPPADALATPQATTLKRRVDAAVTSQATIGEPINLFVQVKRPGTPFLGEKDWPTKHRPDEIDQASEMISLPFPIDRQTGQLSAGRLKLRVVTPDFRIEGAQEKVVEVPPDEDSSVVSFLLTPTKRGIGHIDIEVYWSDECIGTIPFETIIGKTSAPLDMQVHTLTLVVKIDSQGEIVDAKITDGDKLAPQLLTKGEIVDAKITDGDKLASQLLTIRLAQADDRYQIIWEADVIGRSSSIFRSPYDTTTLALVIMALDALQRGPDVAAERLTLAEQEQLTTLGLWSGKQPMPNIHKRVGQALYNALVADPAGATALSTVRNYATAQGQPLAYLLRFPPDAVDLAALPWELLWDNNNPLLLSRGKQAAFVRYLDLDQALPPPSPPGNRLRILAIAPNAGIPPEVREAERTARNTAWGDLVKSGLVDLEELSPATPTKLVDRIQTGPPIDIVHFYGHGRYKDGQGALLFDTATGNTWISADRLAALLADTRLIMLHACQSAMIGETGLLTGVAPALSAAGVPVVVAMQLTVRADAATRFAEVVYRALARGDSVQRGVSQARQALFFEEEDGASWYVPTLTIRARDTEPLRLIQRS